MAGVKGSYGLSIAQLHMPSDVFVTSNRNIYVADRNNNRIQFSLNRSANEITASTGGGFETGGFRDIQVTSSGLIHGRDTWDTEPRRNNTTPFGSQSVSGQRIH